MLAAEVEDPFLDADEKLLPDGTTQSGGLIARVRRITDQDGVVGCCDLDTCAALTRAASMPHQFAS